MTRRILLVNPNTSAPITEMLAAEARRIVGEAAEIVAVTAPFGAASLECRAELVVAAHAVLEAIAAASDYDAVVIGAFGDPGLEAAREISRAPVFGIGQSGLAAAGDGGRRFAIVTIGERMREEIERKVAACGLGGRCVAIKVISGGVLEVASDRGAFLHALTNAAVQCVEERGAAAIVFGGAPFAGIARELGDAVAVPLFDGIDSAIGNAMRAPPAKGAPRADAGAARTKEIAGVSGALVGLIHDFLIRRA